MTSKSPTTTDPDWLENEHAGQVLVAEFLEPEKLSVAQLAVIDALALWMLSSIFGLAAISE